MTLGDLQKHDLIDWFLHRRLPFELLGLFLHEFTHHWCFHSIVGSSLTLLRLQIEHAMMDEEYTTPAGMAAIIQDAIKFEAAIALLRPLAEGLALFAEHNAELGDSPALSLTSHWGLQLFLDRSKPLNKEQVLDYFKMFCWEYRISALAIGRKGNLLTQTIRTDSGGYLPGYLTVRSLERAALSRTKRFLDSDLYLNYVRNHIFGDSRLALLLHDRSLTGKNAVNAIAHHVAERFSLLYSPDLDDRVRSFEEITSKIDVRQPNADIPSHDWSIYVSPEDTAKALDILGRKMRDLTAFSDHERDSSDFNLRITAYATLLQRGLVRLGYIDVDVTVNEYGRVIAYDGENPVVAGQAMSQAGMGKGPGQLVFYLIQDAGTPFLLCLREGKLVAHFETPGSQVRKERISTAFSAATFGLVRHEFSKMFEAMLRSVVTDNDEYQEALAYTKNITEDVYWHKALLFVVPDLKRDEAYYKMQDAGFLGLFEDDEELAYALGALSLAAAGYSTVDHLETVFSKLQLDFRSVLTKLENLQKTAGFLLFESVNLRQGDGSSLKFLHSFV
jgi:hypothetical protein